MAKIFTRRVITLLVIFILLEIVLCVSMEDKALASSSLLTSSEKNLIKKYGWGEDYVERWPDGIIYIYNGTTYKGLPKIIKKINQIIGGKTVFQLSDNKEISKVVFESYASLKYASESDWSWGGHSLKKWVISLSNKYLHDSKNDKLFLLIFTQIAGFNYEADKKKYGEWWEFTIDRDVEKMLRALYKVPPGYNLSTGKIDEIAKPSEEIDTQNTGAINLTSTPSGASVFLDGSFKGVSSITLEKITPGKHMLKVTKTGYQDWQQEVTVSSDKTIEIFVNLTLLSLAPGEINLTSTPAGASVFLDGSFKGVSPIIISNVPVGKHILKVTKSGYQDWQQEITVSSDKTIEIFVSLAQLSSALGEINLTSTPSGAKVFLDVGQYIGKTPLTIDKVSPGKHKVTMVLADYEKYVQEVDVIAGKVIDVSATLVTTRIQSTSRIWSLEGRFINFSSLCEFCNREPKLLSPQKSTFYKGAKWTITGCSTLDEKLLSQQPLAIIIKIHNSTDVVQALTLPLLSDFIVHTQTDSKSALAFYYHWGSVDLRDWVTELKGKIEVELKAGAAMELVYLIPGFNGKAKIELLNIGSFEINEPK